MKSIMMTYPDFAALPKGLKQMLLASESFFFNETKAQTNRAEADKTAVALLAAAAAWLRIEPAWHPSWRN
jgi:hypothetical protein